MFNENDTMQNNKIDLQGEILINDSLLVDELKILNLIKQILNSRGVFYGVPESFADVSQDNLKKIQQID